MISFLYTMDINTNRQKLNKKYYIGFIIDSVLGMLYR